MLCVLQASECEWSCICAQLNVNCARDAVVSWLYFRVLCRLFKCGELVILRSVVHPPDRFDSSVGRASDWRSEGPWFDPESKHHTLFFTKTNQRFNGPMHLLNTTNSTSSIVHDWTLPNTASHLDTWLLGLPSTHRFTYVTPQLNGHCIINWYNGW
jgi:hypothetical protein